MDLRTENLVSIFTLWVEGKELPEDAIDWGEHFGICDSYGRMTEKGIDALKEHFPQEWEHLRAEATFHKMLRSLLGDIPQDGLVIDWLGGVNILRGNVSVLSGGKVAIDNFYTKEMAETMNDIAEACSLYEKTTKEVLKRVIESDASPAMKLRFEQGQAFTMLGRVQASALDSLI